MILGATAAVGLLPDPLFTQQDDDSSWMPWRPSTLPLFRGGNRSCLPGFLRSTTPRTWLCLHEGDLISNKIRQAGEWPDCRKSVSLWQEHIGTGSGGLLIEAGANIGACTMEVRARGCVLAATPHAPHCGTRATPPFCSHVASAALPTTHRAASARAQMLAHTRALILAFTPSFTHNFPPRMIGHDSQKPVLNHPMIVVKSRKLRVGTGPCTIDELTRVPM